jgi:hypothetical protein
MDLGRSEGECWRQSLMGSRHRRAIITEGETDAVTGVSAGLEDDETSIVLGLASATTSKT